MKRLDPRLLRRARAARIHLVVAVALGILTGLLAIAGAASIAFAVDAAFNQGGTLSSLAAPLGVLAIVLGARAAVAWAQEVAAHRASASVRSDLRRDLLAVALRRGADQAEGTRAAEAVALATSGIDALDIYFARFVPEFVLAAILPVVVVLAILPVDAIAAVTVALTVPLIVVFMSLVGAVAEGRRRRRWHALARLSHHFLDVVAGLPTLRLFGRSHVQLDRLATTTDAYRRESLASMRVAFLSALVLELFATLSVALVAVGIGLRLVDGSMAFAAGLFALVLAPEAYLPIRRVGAYYHASETGLAAIDSAFTLLAESETAEAAGPAIGASGAKEAVPDLRLGGSLRVDGLSVLRPGRPTPTPDDCSLQVRAGEVVALAGPSGGGKSTLLAAILGLVPIAAGSIAVWGGPDGRRVDVATLDPEAWRSVLAWVPQVPKIFAGSVADNVRLGAANASETAVVDALRAVGLGDIDPATVVGEGGTGLSSGQRRRLAVARALVRDAAILLLDEPTAGLDEVGERRVLDAIRAAARDRSMAVLLVAHRPAALALADRVVHLGAAAEVAA